MSLPASVGLNTVMKASLNYARRPSRPLTGCDLIDSGLRRPAAPIRRLLPWLALLLAVPALLCGGWLSYLEHENSTLVAATGTPQLRASFARARAWILQNRAAVLSENNAMLWLLVREAGRLADDRQLQSLDAEYQSRSTRGTVSQFFFDSTGIDSARMAHITLGDDWEGYQRLFVYGATCNSPLRFDPEVAAMLSPVACETGRAWLRNPWCRTHQLMGLRFVQKNECEPPEETAQTVRAVQDGILSELNWDFRVEDAYLQKIWTLLESGRRAEIRGIWVRRVVESQRPDGGWNGVGVIVRVPGERAVFWRGGGLHPYVGVVPPSNFHATAQGLYLMALLLNP